MYMPVIGKSVYIAANSEAKIGYAAAAVVVMKTVKNATMNITVLNVEIAFRTWTADVKIVGDAKAAFPICAKMDIVQIV